MVYYLIFIHTLRLSVANFTYRKVKLHCRKAATSLAESKLHYLKRILLILIVFIHRVHRLFAGRKATA